MTPEWSKVNLQLTRTDLICLLDEMNLFFNIPITEFFGAKCALNLEVGKQDVTVVW